MQGSGIFTIAIVFVLGVASLYRVKTLHRKKILHLSIQQLLYLVVIPGLIFPMEFSYLQSMLQFPRSDVAFMPDTVLVSGILLATLFLYGGIAIHAVTKMLSDYLVNEQSEARELNRFFHHTFSHNLTFSSAVVACLLLTILELNHVSTGDVVSWRWGILRGILISISFWFAVYNYARYTGSNYSGKWNDLRLTFALVWVAFCILLYLVQRFDLGFSDYQLLLPILVSFSSMAALSLVLVIRKLRRGTWRIWVGRRRLQHYLSLEERA